MLADGSRVADVDLVIIAVCEAEVVVSCLEHFYLFLDKVSEATPRLWLNPRRGWTDFLEYVVDTLSNGLQFNVCYGGTRLSRRRRLGLVNW